MQAKEPAVGRRPNNAIGIFREGTNFVGCLGGPQAEVFEVPSRILWRRVEARDAFCAGDPILTLARFEDIGHAPAG